MMTKHKTSRHAAWKYALVLPLLMGLVVVFSCKATQNNALVKKELNKETSTKTVNIDSDEKMEEVVESTSQIPQTKNYKKNETTIGKETKTLNLLNKLLTREFVERPMLVVDGEEKDSYYLMENSFVGAEEVIEMSENDAIVQYGEKAKYGYVEIKKPKFDFKQKYLEAMEKKFENDSFYLTDLKKFKDLINTTLSIVENYHQEQKSRKVDVPLFKLESGEIVQIPAFANIKKGDILVSGNGIPLKEDEDYVVDYQNGTMQVINSFVIKGRQSIKVSFKK